MHSNVLQARSVVKGKLYDLSKGGELKMKTFHLKTPESLMVIGTTEAGDYIVVNAVISGGFDVSVVNKADFEAKYVEDVAAAPAPVDQAAPHDGQPKPAVQA